VRRIVALLVFLLLAYSSFALEFRKSSWLMTSDEVIASETARIVSETYQSGQQQIVFRTQVSGFPATITYILENDKLFSASCTFKRDPNRKAFNAMLQELIDQKGKPSFEKDNLVGWRLERTEIALAHLPDGTSYAAYWEKQYFARINNLGGSGGPARF
jgi:hypothetical protein